MNARLNLSGNQVAASFDAAKYYDEDQLAALVCTIAFINPFNRGFVMVAQPAGDYQPGQSGGRGGSLS